MRYYLWDTDVAKLLGTYGAEDEALILVRTLVDRYGDAYAEELSLGVELDDGSTGEALGGASLLARSKAVLSGAAATRS